MQQSTVPHKGLSLSLANGLIAYSHPAPNYINAIKFNWKNHKPSADVLSSVGRLTLSHTAPFKRLCSTVEIRFQSAIVMHLSLSLSLSLGQA